METTFTEANFLSTENETVFNTFKGIALFLLVLWTIVANSLVFIVLYKNPRLQTVPNLLVGNLAFSDLCLSLIVLPLSSVYALSGEWIFPEMLCVIFVSADILCCTASIWNLSIVGLDRYWAITSPVAYMQKRNKKTAFYMIISVWIFSSIISLAPLLGWKQMANHGNYRVQNGTAICDFLDLPTYTIYSATGSFFIPTILMFFVYFKIYRAFAKHRQRQIYRQKLAVSSHVIKKHIESTILHEISHVLPTSDEFAKEEDEEEENDSNSSNSHHTHNGTSSTIITSNFDNKVANNNKPMNDIIIEEDEDAINEEVELKINDLMLKDNDDDDIHTLNNNIDPQDNDSNFNNFIVDNSNFKDKNVEDYNDDDVGLEKDLSFGKELKQNGIKRTAIANDDSLTYVVLRKKSNDKSTLKQSILSKPTTAMLAKKNHISNRLLKRVPSGPKKKKNYEKQVVFKNNSSDLEKDRRNSTELVSMVYEKIHKRHIRKEKGMTGIRNSLRTKPKAISAAKERRGVKVLGIILGCFTICWTPFFIMYVVVQFCETCTINPHIEMFITWLGYSNSAMNPIIYTVFNRDYQIALKRLFTNPEKVSLLRNKR
uniref:G_PROTEIN_RECEP_F1_2 domain-containing protein n=1 Tax=Parastrongyloides trichosuri TaxID=131310 RepID=A0A0N4ZXR0_PARTI